MIADCGLRRYKCRAFPTFHEPVVDVSDINNPRKVMGYYGGGGRVLDVSGELRGDLYQ